MPEVLLVEFCEDWPLGTVAVVDELLPPPLVGTLGGAGEGDLLGTLIMQLCDVRKSFQENYSCITRTVNIVCVSYSIRILYEYLI